MDEIILRALEPEDLDVLYSVENDIELWSVGYTTVPYSRYLLHNYIANSTCDIYADRQMRLMAETADGGEVVGIVDITGYEPRHNRAELGLVVLRQYQRRGYAEAAVVQVLDYARHILHLHQLYVIIDQRNEAALQIFRKYCFIAGRTLKDWLFDGEKYHDASFFQRIL